MIVNYVRECTAFIAYASDNKITANEFVLWHALFNAINQRAASSDWPDGFIPVSNSRLLSLTTLEPGKPAKKPCAKPATGAAESALRQDSHARRQQPGDAVSGERGHRLVPIGGSEPTASS